MSTTMTKPDSSRRRSTLDRDVAMRLAAEEYQRFADTLAALSPDDWAKPTNCPPWDVRQMACHTVGMAEMAAGLREQMRQQRTAAAEAKAAGCAMIDALTDLQVRERADWTPEQVVAGMRSVAPRAACNRRRTPFFMRRLRLPEKQVVGGREETWTIGFVVETILTRDPWMHRMDLALATGKAPTLTADHDGVIVADVVAEWAERHGRPYRLALTGPAGGTWSAGSGGQLIEMDAVDFCRVLSGRGSGEGLLTTEVPF